MEVDEAKSAELVARLETLPFSKWHRDFFIPGFIGVMFDAADFALFGAALPPIETNPIGRARQLQAVAATAPRAAGGSLTRASAAAPTSR